MFQKTRVKFLYNYLSRSRIIKAYLTSILGVFSGLLTQLLFIRALTIEVSAEDFSLYAFIFQIVTYLSILQLGLDFTISREIAINVEKNDLSAANYSYSFIKRFNNKIVVVCIIAVVLISALFLLGIGIPRGYNNATASILIFVFGIFQIFTFYSRPFVSALIGANYQNITNINNVLINVGSTLFGYILLKLGFGLYSLPISMSLWAIANLFLLRSIAQKKCSWIIGKMPPINKILDKASLKFGLTGTLGGIAWTIEATADVILLNATGMMSLVGMYVIWWRFPQMLFDLAGRLTTSAYPSIAAAHGISSERSEKIISKLIIAASGFAFIIAVGLFLWLPTFINLWVGPKYYYPDFKSFSLLIAYLVFLRILGNCFSLSLVSIGKVNITASFSWIQAVIKIILGYLLVLRFQLPGLVFASVICALIQVIGLGYYLLRNKLFNGKLLTMLGIMSAILLSFIAINTYIKEGILVFSIGVILTAASAAALWFVCIRVFGYNKLLFK